jgi:polar amino acid transport system substrate-binding protein
VNRLTIMTGMGLAALLAFPWITPAADNQKPIRVGISPTSPPVRFKELNKVTGLEVDFAEALGKELGRRIEFHELKFSNLIPELRANNIDIIMSGMSTTYIRGLQIDFSNSYLKVEQKALARAEDEKLYGSALDVITAKKVVGAKENTTGEFLLMHEFNNAQKRFFPSPEKGAQALKKKQIDLLVLDSPYVSWLASKNEKTLVALPFALSEENLAWAVRKGDTDFLNAINAALEKWKANGFWKETVTKWLPGS